MHLQPATIAAGCSWS